MLRKRYEPREYRFYLAPQSKVFQDNQDCTYAIPAIQFIFSAYVEPTTARKDAYTFFDTNFPILFTQASIYTRVFIIPIPERRGMIYSRQKNTKSL